MQRSLPTFLCAVLVTGLSACDQPVDGPTTEDEIALYNFRAAGGLPAIPGYPGDGDLTMTRAGANSGGGGINFDFDIINNAVKRSTDGELVATQTDDAIIGSDGSVECTVEDNGLFKKLRNSDGTSLYCALGPWVFSDCDVEGLDPIDAYQVLHGSVLASFDDTSVVNDLSSLGDDVAESNVELSLSTVQRKLLITAMLDGTCGGDKVTNSGL